MQHGRGAAFFPFADAIVEPKQMGEALWVLEGRPLALGTLGMGEGGHRSEALPRLSGLGQATHQSRVLAP